MRYEIRLAGHLPRNWTDWFDGFTCTTVEGAASDDAAETAVGARMPGQGAAAARPVGETILIGSVPDQSALLGLLNTVCRLNLTLLSVRRID